MKPIEIQGDVIRTRPRLVRIMRWIMLAGLIGGPIVFAIGLFQYLEVQKLKVEGVTVEAAVHDLSVLNTGKGRRVYKVVADYQPEGLPKHRKEFVVPKDDYDAASSSRTVKVTYLPSNPGTSVAGSDPTPDTEALAIGAVLFLVGVLLFLYFRGVKKAIKRSIFSEAEIASKQPK